MARMYRREDRQAALESCADEVARRTVWRMVRSAGSAGMTREQLEQRLLGQLGRARLDWAISELRRRTFIRLIREPGLGRDRAGHPMLYRVDLDCRVPAGESAELGPGYEVEMAILRRQVAGATLQVEA